MNKYVNNKIDIISYNTTYDATYWATRWATNKEDNNVVFYASNVTNFDISWIPVKDGIHDFLYNL